MSSFPIAPRRPKTITQHGHTRVDDYFWLRDRNDPAVLEYLTVENDYLAEVMQHTQALQQTLFEEMKGRIQENDTSAPERRGGYVYYTRTEAGKDYPYYCRKAGGPDGEEELLLDQNALGQGAPFCKIGAYAPSPDHARLAYSVDLAGDEVYTLYVKDLTTGEVLADAIENTSANSWTHDGVEWAADSAHLFYVTLDTALRPCRMFVHRLGTDLASDRLLYHEADETYFLYIGKTRSGAYIAAYSHATLTSEWRILPADEPHGQLQVFQARRTGIEYDIEHHGQQFYVITNDQALNFKLMAAPLDATGSDHWREVLPHRPEVLLESIDAFENHLVLLERKAGLRQLRISPASDLGQARYVEFPEPVYTLQLAANPEYHTNRVRFNYSSLTTPNSVVDFDMDRGEWLLQKQDKIPSGHDPANYVSRRLYAAAPDGTRVPISLIHKQGLALNGANPTVLFGYGSYGYCLDPAFDQKRFSLVDRGFVVAIAHVRGGSELGRGWYEAGRLSHKRNSFTDFIACAEHLIAEGYTNSRQLGIYGVSAGGLLVGACLTMRPDLFGAVVARVPFVDVVNTMSDPTIPLTTLEYDQWGNPDNPDDFDILMSYSPYENLRPGRYPHLLLTAGLNDPRVAYWEPAKFAARLRTLNSGQGMVLLNTNLEAGHGGASGRYDFLKEYALDYAFLIDRLAGA